MQAFHLDIVDSTNEFAKRMIASGEIRAAAYVVAREQTCGKGSRGRAWLSPRDAGVYLSVVDIPREPIDGRGFELTEITLAAGVACVEAIAETTGLCVQLKPINDIYAGGRKLGGILTEAIVEQAQIKAIVAGIGVNVRRADRPLPNGSAQPTCLQELCDMEYTNADTQRLIESLIEHCRRWIAAALGHEPRVVRAAWERHKIPGASLACPDS